MEKTKSLRAADRVCNYYMIDLIKFLCCILVFIVHIKPFPNDAFPMAEYVNFGLQKYIGRIAVPFFLAASGFFLFRKIDFQKPDGEIVKNYCFKILRLLAIWYILLFNSEKVHLWYLGSTVVAVLMLYLLLRAGIKLPYLWGLAVILYTAGLFGDSYYGLLAPLRNVQIIDLSIKSYEYFFIRTRNGVFMGYLFVLMGATFARGNIKIAPWISVSGFVLSMFLLFGEVFLLKFNQLPRDYNMYAFLVPAVFFLFSFAVRFDRVREDKTPFFGKLRTAGVLVYFIHFLMESIVLFGNTILRTLFHIDFSAFMFLITLAASICVAILITRLSEKEKFKWLQYLYR